MIDRSTFTGPLIWSASAITLCVILVLVGLAPIVGAAFTGGIGEQRPSEFLARLERAHERSLETDIARVDGRNLFYVTQPKPKPRPTRPAPIVTNDEPKEPIPPPPPVGPPANYGGPSIIAVMGEVVWFSPTRSGEKPLIVRTGEEKNGVTVIATSPPWSARIGHEGGEYDVGLLDREFPGLLTTASVEAEAPGLIAASPAPEAPPAVEAPEPMPNENDPAEDADEADGREAEAADAAPADDVLAARNGEPSGKGGPDRGSGRPRPAVPKPTPPRPEVR